MSCFWKSQQRILPRFLKTSRAGLPSLLISRGYGFFLCPSEIAYAFSFFLETDDLGYMSLARGCLIYHHV